LDHTRSATQLASSPNAIYQVPKLTGHLKFFKPKKRYSFKNYKQYFFVLQDSTLTMFKDEHSLKNAGTPVDAFSLKNTEIKANVNVKTGKFVIKLSVHCQHQDTLQELWLRCENQDQYADWMAACQLVARGKTMASRAQYDKEVRATLKHLELQTPVGQPMLNVDDMPSIVAEDYLAACFVKKARNSRVINAKILERHTKVRERNSTDAKLEYIKTWQRLSTHDITYFIGRFDRLKRNELLGVSSSRVMRLDSNTGEVLNTWRYRDMKCWTVNWETNQVLLEINDGTVSFQPLYAPCKTVHEFIGGYVFLNMRKPEKNQNLNEELFYKLTGGIEE